VKISVLAACEFRRTRVRRKCSCHIN